MPFDPSTSTGPCLTFAGSIGANPANRSVSVGAGNGTKCITMPLANHIANSKQNATPSQRCSRMSARIIARLSPISPLGGSGNLIGPWRAEEDLIWKSRIGPGSVNSVRQIADAERDSDRVDRAPWQIFAGNIDKRVGVRRGVGEKRSRIILKEVSVSN